MSETNPNPPLVRTYNTTFPIRACRLRRDDLKLLYRIINDRQLEYRETVLNQLSQIPNESPEEFQARRTRVANAFTTHVVITGTHQEVQTGQHESFFDIANIPEHILNVFYTTISGPAAIGLAEPQQRIRTTLFLDFSRPTALDFSKLPTLATENASKFTIFSASESWFTALHKRMTDLFNERKTGFDWLHKQGIYDFLLLLVGIPFSLAIDYLVSGPLDRLQLHNVLTTALYVYFFIAGLYIFRGLFTYSRWVFPKVEIESRSSPPLRHRGVWLLIIPGIPGAVFGAAIWDAIKALW